MLFFTSAASIDIWAHGASELVEKHDANQSESGGSNEEIFKVKTFHKSGQMVIFMEWRENKQKNDWT